MATEDERRAASMIETATRIQSDLEDVQDSLETLLGELEADYEAAYLAACAAASDET